MKSIYQYFQATSCMETFFRLTGDGPKFITGWHENDACYRDEYMGGLLEYCGAVIKPLPKHLKQLADIELEHFFDK